MASRDQAKSRRRVVADASAVINLVASGAVLRIARVLRAPIRVLSAVALELESGRPRWTTSDDLAELAKAGIIEIVDLDDAASRYFEELVVGTAVETLDDGEAATIAYALTRDLEALIDERKACRICAERYAALAVTTTVEFLLDPTMEAELGPDGVVDALFRALKYGRMRVPPSQVERVVRILGPERTALCNSLPLHARTAQN